MVHTPSENVGVKYSLKLALEVMMSGATYDSVDAVRDGGDRPRLKSSHGR